MLPLFPLLLPPTVASDPLSHSRGRQRAGPVLQGSATHSGKADVSLECSPICTSGWSPAPLPLLLCSAQQWTAVPPEPGWTTFSPNAVDPFILLTFPQLTQLYLQTGSAGREPDGKCKKTAQHMSSGTFMFYCPTFLSLPVSLTEQGAEG